MAHKNSAHTYKRREMNLACNFMRHVTMILIYVTSITGEQSFCSILQGWLGHCKR